MTWSLLPLLACASSSAGGSFAGGSPSASAHTEAGRALIERSLRAHGPLDGRAPLSLHCEGTLWDLGHYPKPFELRSYRLTRVLTYDPVRGATFERGTLAQDGESYSSELAVDRTGVHRLEFDATATRPNTPSERVTAQHRAAELFPSRLLELALSEGRELRALGIREVAGRRLEAVAFRDAADVPHTLYLDPESGLLTRAARSGSARAAATSTSARARAGRPKFRRGRAASRGLRHRIVHRAHQRVSRVSLPRAADLVPRRSDVSAQ